MKVKTYEVVMRLKGNYDRGKTIVKGSKDFCEGYVKGAKDFSKLVGWVVFFEIWEAAE